MEEWLQQLNAERVEHLGAAELLTARDALEKAPITERGARPPEHATPAAIEGATRDAHGLAKLLRAWLKASDDAAQVDRFRSLFGELVWRSMANAYPKLLHEVEAEMSRRK